MIVRAAETSDADSIVYVHYAAVQAIPDETLKLSPEHHMACLRMEREL
jgi:phage tail protein X